jgi:hypothetical protein
MDLAMARWDGDASVASQFAAGAMVECLEGEGVLDSRVWEPLCIVERGRVVEAYLVVEVGDMGGRGGILGSGRTV